MRCLKSADEPSPSCDDSLRLSFGLLLVLQAGLVFPHSQPVAAAKRPSPPPKTRGGGPAAPTLRWSSTSPTPSAHLMFRT